jgi:hypothetical protein
MAIARIILLVNFKNETFFSKLKKIGEIDNIDIVEFLYENVETHAD